MRSRMSKRRAVRVGLALFAVAGLLNTLAVVLAAAPALAGTEVAHGSEEVIMFPRTSGHGEILCRWLASCWARASPTT